MEKEDQTMRRILVVLCAVALFCGFALQTQAAITYAVTDLGTMGQYSSYAQNMSEAGSVIGYAELNDNKTYFRFDQSSTMTDIPVTHFPYQAENSMSDVVDVNSDGHVLVERYKDGIHHAFTWQAGAPVEIGNPVEDTYARSINDHNQIVGTRNVSGNYGAFVSDSGSGIQPIPGISSLSYSGAFRINNNGVVLGSYTTANQVHGFLYDTVNQAFSDIGLLGSFVSVQGTIQSTPKGLNNLNQVISDGFTASEQHAMYWDNQRDVVDMGTLGGSTSIACDINDLGIAVGNSSLSSGYTTHGYLWTLDGGMKDLNSLLELSSTWTIIDARAINNANQIAGTALGLDGVAHAVLLTPSSVPEPSTWALLVAGSLIAMIFLFRRIPNALLRKE